jgi:hypothetical protein
VRRREPGPTGSGRWTLILTGNYGKALDTRRSGVPGCLGRLYRRGYQLQPVVLGFGHLDRDGRQHIAHLSCDAGHPREAFTAFAEACTAFLRITSRIGANAFEHFRRAALRSAPSSSRCQRDMSLLIRSH